MKTAQDLKQHLLSINKRSYPAYKDTRGSYRFGSYILNIDHVQGDPFASPSRISILVPGQKAGFPSSLYDLPHKQTALEDCLIRLFGKELEHYQFKAKGSGKSGLMSISRPGQEILKRTACSLSPDDGSVTLRLAVGFPANGRTINSGELIKILFDFLPACVEKTLFYSALNPDYVRGIIDLAEDQQYIREQLKEKGLVSFVANGSILPRESGVSSRPMKKAVPFQSPASMEITLSLPHYGSLTGMGIRKGISLIIGGGYHGKSTLLKALELGVYNHIKGDGREFVITDETAMKIRAEDGRSIHNTDISMFINNLPGGRNTRNFQTEDASGSTSQAANVVEAIEAGTSLLLIDEDTCATNFMIRDELMQRVVHRDQEPITPFIERVRTLYEIWGISSVIVAGSSGSYFHIADQIIQMDCYVPSDITALAKEEARNFPLKSQPLPMPALPDFNRRPSGGALRPQDRIKMKTLGKDAFSINRDTVDLRYVEQLADSEQTTALSWYLRYAMLHICDGKKDLRTVIRILLKLTDEKGLEALGGPSGSNTDMAMPRPQELYACFNRCRSLRM
ncbi:MAG: ABC-ATPase domain-containing protein [Ruminococcus sp.]